MASRLRDYLFFTPARFDQELLPELILLKTVHHETSFSYLSLFLLSLDL